MSVSTGISEAVILTSCGDFPQESLANLNEFAENLEDIGFTPTIDINQDPFPASYAYPPDKWGFQQLAAPLEMRARQLADTIRDPSIDLIISANGGEGGFAAGVLARRYLEAEGYQPQRIPTVVGFSDFDGVLAAIRPWAKCIEGHPIANPEGFDFVFRDLILGNRRNYAAIPLVAAIGEPKTQSFEAPIQGGHWWTFMQVKQVLDPAALKGCILFLEYVTFEGEWLDEIKAMEPCAIVLGASSTIPKSNSLESLGIPMFSGFPFGHGYKGLPQDRRFVPHGTTARLERKEGSWILDLSAQQPEPGREFSFRPPAPNSAEITLRGRIDKMNHQANGARWMSTRDLFDIKIPLLSMSDLTEVHRLHIEIDGGVTKTELFHMLRYARSEVLPLLPDHIDVLINGESVNPDGKEKGVLGAQAVRELQFAV